MAMENDSSAALTEQWEEFKTGWYEDQQTKIWHRDFPGGWHITVTPDSQESWKFAWWIFNHFTKEGDHREPFKSRLSAARNVFAHLMVWSNRTSPEVGVLWLQEIAANEFGCVQLAEVVN